MSRICDLTGKKPLTGNNVSHSKVKTKRKFYPNLHSKKFFIPELEQWISLKVSSTALRTIDKKGIFQYLKDLDKKGKISFNYKK